MLDRADCADFGCHNSIRLETKHFLNTLALTFISFSGRFVFAMQKHYLFFCERSSSYIFIVLCHTYCLIGYIVMGSWKSRGNQHIRLVMGAPLCEYCPSTKVVSCTFGIISGLVNNVIKNVANPKSVRNI